MEVAARDDRERPPTGVFTALIVAGLVLAAILLPLVLRSPGSGLRLAVGNPVGTACPPGQGIPVCFDVTVTNTGSETAVVRCVVEAAKGNSATFLAGGRTYTTAGTLRPGQPLDLGVAVTTQTDVVLTPLVTCDPA
jgi:hypothetical protein